MKSISKDYFLDLIHQELSAFFKICPICENKFKDTLDKRTICISCERNQKIKELGINQYVGLTLGKTYNADLMSNYLNGNYVYRILDDDNQLVWYNDEVLRDEMEYKYWVC